MLSLGSKVTSETYFTGMRRYLLNKSVQIFSFLILTTAGIYVTKKDLKVDDVDYSFYLGPNWKQELAKLKSAPKIISPHSSCFDIQVLLSTFEGNCSFVAGAFVKGIPILGSLATKLGSVFVPRAGK